jgi:hypothetical protein
VKAEMVMGTIEHECAWKEESHVHGLFYFYCIAQRA